MHFANETGAVAGAEGRKCGRRSVFRLAVILLYSPQSPDANVLAAWGVSECDVLPQQT
jgi:hypothetical protein